jgi:hypothetical protein
MGCTTHIGGLHAVHQQWVEPLLETNQAKKVSYGSKEKCRNLSVNTYKVC